jgi:hypothetical protein
MKNSSSARIVQLAGFCILRSAASLTSSSRQDIYYTEIDQYFVLLFGGGFCVHYLQ